MPKLLKSLTSQKSHLDYYRATVKLSAMEVVGTAATVLDLKQERARPAMFYDSALELVDAGGWANARVYYGGKNPYPLIQASGEYAEPVAEMIREFWPDEHLPTRIDVALDFCELGLYDRLVPWLIEKADQYSVDCKPNGDWFKGRERTLYVGSRTSVAFLRFYEKGHEQRKRGVKDAPLEWSRMELELKPKGHERELSARMKPDEMWGFSNLSRDVFEELASLPCAKLARDRRHATRLDQKVEAMARQYGNTWRELVQREGGVCEAGVHLTDTIDRLKR